MENKAIKVPCTLEVKNLVSKAGKPFSVVNVVVNGKTVPMGFLSESLELALIKAGVLKV